MLLQWNHEIVCELLCKRNIRYPQTLHSCCKQWPKQEFQRDLSAEETHRYVVGFLTAAKQVGYLTPITIDRNLCIFKKYPCSSGADYQSGHHPQFINLKLQKKRRLYSSPQHQSSILPICLHLQKLKYLISQSYISDFIGPSTCTVE